MIKIRNLNKKYQDNIVFNNANFDIETNKITGIMGKSGCGKTTLLKILSGIEPYDSGTIENIPTNISFVFQDDIIVSTLSPLKNIRCAIGNKQSLDTIKEHLNELGLLHYINKPSSELSGGMKRRIAIIRAILAKSEIIFMDEPFKGLDEITRNIVIQYIKNHLNNRTLIFVTHDEEEIKLLNAQLITISK